MGPLLTPGTITRSVPSCPLLLISVISRYTLSAECKRPLKIRRRSRRVLLLPSWSSESGVETSINTTYTLTAVQPEFWEEL